MKRIIMLLIVTLFGVTLFGCNTEKEEVSVDFRIGEASKIITLNSGSIITEDIVPIENSLEKYLLFYDYNFSDKYNNEPIYEDTTIYVRFRDNEFYRTLGEEEAFKLIKEDYYNKYLRNSPNNQETVEDISFSRYFGNYNGSYVVQIHLTGGGEGWYAITTLNIGGVILTFPTTTTATVWNKGSFYTLEEAYEKELLTIDDLEKIASICNKGGSE